MTQHHEVRSGQRTLPIPQALRLMRRAVSFLGVVDRPRLVTDTTPNQRPTIILCESYASLREALTAVLGARYHVASVRRITELPPLLKRVRPHLLFIDVDEQPEFRHVLNVLRHLPKRCNEVPILLLSGFWSLEQQRQALNVTTVSFLPKPFSLPVLLDKVDTLIRGYSTAPITRRVIRVAAAAS